MTAFSDQRQQLRKALVEAGLPAETAARIANILGNREQAMSHAGPISTDTTPDGLRQVDAGTRKALFSNLDNRSLDPDYRPPLTEPSEQRTPPKPEPNVLEAVSPQQSDSRFRMIGGSLAEVVGAGQEAVVNVRKTVVSAPPDGLPITLLDQQSNQLVGKSARAVTDDNTGTVRFDILHSNSEVVWALEMPNRAEYDVVTGVEFVPGRGLEVQYKKIMAWDRKSGSVDLIPTVEHPVVTDIADDKYGLRGTRRNIVTLSSTGATNAFFNTFRIGKFTGGWAAGTDKQVMQVWPQSDATPTVKNLTRDVADTEDEKYVLFAARTQDFVPPLPTEDAPRTREDHISDNPRTIADEPKFDVNGELVRDRDSPVVEYYAIEIQQTRKLVTVITGVELTVDGLSFERRNVYVLDDEPADPLVIGTTACDAPPPE